MYVFDGAVRSYVFAKIVFIILPCILISLDAICREMSSLFHCFAEILFVQFFIPFLHLVSRFAGIIQNKK
jgi:uncharacterized protein YqhQ